MKCRLPRILPPEKLCRNVPFWRYDVENGKKMGKIGKKSSQNPLFLRKIARKHLQIGQKYCKIIPKVRR